MEKDEGIIGMKMPARYVAEMFVDRVSASRTYQKENYREHPSSGVLRAGGCEAGQLDPPGDGRSCSTIF